MSSMESKTTLVLFIGLLLTVSYLTPVNAVTDAELEALEKQIEQLETEEKKQAKAEEKKKAETDAEAKRKAEQIHKANAEAERKRLAELERQRVEEEVLKKKEQEKKWQYNKLIAEAEEATDKNNYDLGEANYNNALEIYINDERAQAGLNHIQELKNICLSIIGVWGWDGTKQTMTFEPGGVVVHRAAFNTVIRSNWECADPANYKFNMIYKNNVSHYFLSKDGIKLQGQDPWGNISFAKRKTEK